MRLLKVQDGKVVLTRDLTDDLPPYAILSHTWRHDDDMEFCRNQAASDYLQYFWVDTCCIDKSNSTELSTAINSMFRWYQEATRCYVYLSDVSADASSAETLFAWESAFRKSKWFTRGWTLQELLAPSSVEFFSSQGQRLGDKKSLERQLHEITGIPVAALRGYPLSDFTLWERMSWARDRTTKIEEDKAYALLGIFEVNLPLIYGEGLEKPADQTCLWLFEHELYQDWLHGRNRNEHRGLLWLKGKPGTGKSILLKEAYRRAAQRQGKSDYCTAAFFFNAKGDELEHSPLGLFRSLLFQLLPRYREHLHRFRETWAEKNPVRAEHGSQSCSWRVPELRSFFESMFTQPTTKRAIIFIDALDECSSKNTRSLAYFWRLITRHLFTVTLSDCPNIFMELCNDQDIKTYVEQRLQLGIAHMERRWYLLRDRILSKSSGVFLWVVLVVDDALKSWDDGKGLLFMLNQVTIVPGELETLFSQMLSSIDPKDRHLTARVFHWAVLAGKTLRLHEWHHIMAFSRQPPPSSLHEWRMSDSFTETEDQLEKQIRSISKGLIEVKDPSISTAVKLGSFKSYTSRYMNSSCAARGSSYWIPA
ncbi:heterokaryon incompatibility protein (HET) domain-containing protein [Hirsutella rhossiliensis]|uniref:Heterokaryon incompatibility protein (HET) domain-containing protein n=1 Tax=Hirsutella rhossiliensis TaxID=111463 RepID=A0A9P8MYE9_9HYPO|nr:heterokaryon incompatibility protein (HET) domain-containing protein [Hirsutella rhossiliensis]KAH0964348.1 heterokaryon incompatibility protein (HET) domain-containing protein [Hirsutella rhossiliensis]